MARPAAGEPREAGLAGVRVRAVEGPLWPVVQVADDDPALFAASTHLLVVGTA